jgi:hypothetical protein
MSKSLEVIFSEVFLTAVSAHPEWHVLDHDDRRSYLEGHRDHFRRDIFVAAAQALHER